LSHTGHRSKRTLLILLLLLAAPELARGAELVFEDGFESGAIDRDLWNPQVYDVTGGATLATASGGGPVRSGEYALRIKLEEADLDPNGKSRSELRPRSYPTEIAYRAAYDVPHVYTLSLYLPPDWEPDAPEIVAQWHGKPDVDEGGEDIEPRRSPPLALRMTYLEDPLQPGSFLPAWNIVVHWDDLPVTTDDTSSVQLVTILEPTDASPDLGRWVDWRFEVTWDWHPSGTGSVRVVKDGEQVALYSGPNAFNDEEGPNSKIGLYKWNWPPDTNIDLRVAYYDDIRIERAAIAVPSLAITTRILLVAMLFLLGLGSSSCVFALSEKRRSCHIDPGR